MKRILTITLILLSTTFGAQAICKAACNTCSGGGVCHMCDGGRKASGGGECYTCSGSGKCYVCEGSGKF